MGWPLPLVVVQARWRRHAQRDVRVRLDACEAPGTNLPKNSGLDSLNGSCGRSIGGFSLIEVVLAVGIFATVIVGVIGLLGPSVRSVRDVIDSTIVARIADGVDMELRLVGFGGVVGATTGNEIIPLVATASGTRIEREAGASRAPSAGSPSGIAPEDRYFLIEVGRAVAPAYNPGDASLVLTVRVSWPYMRPGLSTPIAPSDRSVYVFNTAIVP